MCKKAYLYPKDRHYYAEDERVQTLATSSIILPENWYTADGDVGPKQGPYDQKYMNRQGYVSGKQLLEAGKLLDAELKQVPEFDYNQRSSSFSKPIASDNTRVAPFQSFGKAYQGFEKQYNGLLGITEFSRENYNNFSKNWKRRQFYRLSKVINIRSGEMYQGVKVFAKEGGKLMRITKPLGNLGVGFSAGVIAYEAVSGNWNTHTVVNGAMLGIMFASAIFVVSPAVLYGIAIYGILDYFFDLGGAIDSLYSINN